MTSSDVLDTSFNIQLVQSGKILIKDMNSILQILKRQANKHKFTPCIGRSHGIHAEPITFGLKLASFYMKSLKETEEDYKVQFMKFQHVLYQEQLELLQI